MSMSEEEIKELCDKNDWEATDKHLRYLIEIYGDAGSVASFVMPMLLNLRDQFNNGMRTDVLKRSIWEIEL